MKFEVTRWPQGFPRNEGDRVLANHVKSGRSMAEIMVELRGQDYAVGTRLADLVRAGSLKPVASAGFVAPPDFDTVTVDLDEELARLEEEEAAVSAALDDGSIELETVPGLAPRSTRVLPAAADLPSPSVEPLPPEPVELEPDMIIEPEVPSTYHPPGRPPDPVFQVAGQPENSPTVAALTRALVLFRAGDLEGSRQSLLEVLDRDPMNALARQRLHEVDGALAARAVAAGLRPEQRVMLAVSVDGLVGQPFPPNDAFILTRLAAGPVALGDLVRICPLPQNEVLGAVQRYLTTGVLRFA